MAHHLLSDHHLTFQICHKGPPQGSFYVLQVLCMYMMCKHIHEGRLILLRKAAYTCSRGKTGIVTWSHATKDHSMVDPLVDQKDTIRQFGRAAPPITVFVTCPVVDLWHGKYWWTAASMILSYLCIVSEVLQVRKRSCVSCDCVSYLCCGAETCVSVSSINWSSSALKI